MSSSRKRKNGFIRSTYFCHRDGNFIPKGRNLRHLKVKGSNKINAHCPAKMDVDIGERIVIVSYITTHLGHELDVTRMSLDRTDRAVIANKLAHRVPFEQILYEINSPSKDSELKRVNYLTRKDLWNIVDTFKINPKSVVYSKTRLRRKKNIEKPKKEPKRKRMCYKYTNQKSDNTDGNEIMVNNGEEVKYATDGQVIAINQGDEENIIICPVLKEENEEYSQEYALVSDETGGTYYIVNAEGELESISGHHVMYTEDGEVKLCETSSEIRNEELSQQTQSVLLVQESMEDNVHELVTLNESYCLTSDQVKKEHGRSPVKLSKTTTMNKTFEPDNSDRNIAFVPNQKPIVHINVNELPENEQTIRLIKTEKEIDCDLDIPLKENSSNEELKNQQVTVAGEELEVENSPEYEVTIANYEEEENGYVIVAADEDFNQCTVISDIGPTEDEFDQSDYTLKTSENVTLKDEDSVQSTVKEEVVDTYVMDEEESTVVLEEEPQWNEKRKEVLHKLLNVHNMINNEKQLKFFSKNISSLEHVLKALSKSDETVPQPSESNIPCEKRQEEGNPKNSCR